MGSSLGLVVRGGASGRSLRVKTQKLGPGSEPPPPQNVSFCLNSAALELDTGGPGLGQEQMWRSEH